MKRPASQRHDEMLALPVAAVVENAGQTVQLSAPAFGMYVAIAQGVGALEPLGQKWPMVHGAVHKLVVSKRVAP